jgi:hypothetical protein
LEVGGEFCGAGRRPSVGADDGVVCFGLDLSVEQFQYDHGCRFDLDFGDGGGVKVALDVDGDVGLVKSLVLGNGIVVGAGVDVLLQVVVRECDDVW